MKTIVYAVSEGHEAAIRDATVRFGESAWSSGWAIKNPAKTTSGEYKVVLYYNPEKDNLGDIQEAEARIRQFWAVPTIPLRVLPGFVKRPQRGDTGQQTATPKRGRGRPRKSK